MRNKKAKLFLFFIILLPFILFSCNNSFMQDLLPKTELYYTVSFHANEATSGTSPVTQTALQNELIVIPAKGNLAKTNFAFSCWNTQSDGNGENFIPGQQYKVTDNQTLYAKWVAEQTHMFPFLQPENNAPIVSGITISQTDNGDYPLIGILEISNSENYNLIEWFYGSVKLGEGNNLELNATDIRYNLAGTHNITVVAWQNGIPYSMRISFNIIR